MDNPQETFSVPYIAGLMDGEGSFFLNKVSTRKTDSYRASIQFTNTDTKLIDIMISFCKINDIRFHIRNDNRIGRKACYQLSPTNLQSRLRFLEIVRPFLRGDKYYESGLVEKFIKNRIRKNNCYSQQ